MSYDSMLLDEADRYFNEENNDTFPVCLHCGSYAVEKIVNGKLLNHIAEIGERAKCFDCKTEFTVEDENIMTDNDRKKRWPNKIALENGEFDGDENCCCLCGSQLENDGTNCTNQQCVNHSETCGKCGGYLDHHEILGVCSECQKTEA